MTYFINGYCPMGCGRTLFIATGGYVTCASPECPRPGAAATLLDDRETEHLVEFREDDFTVRHPLRERLDDALMACELHVYIRDFAGPPAQLGRYRAQQHEGQWTWEPLRETQAEASR